MMIASPAAAAAAKPPAAPLPNTPGSGAAAPAPPATTPAAPAGAAPGAPGAPSPADAAAAKAAVVDKLMKTTASEALGTVSAHLDALSKLTIGGATPEGTKAAKSATALLTDASMLLQHAHVKAVNELKTMAGELQMRVMGSASGLAFLAGQVALAGDSKTPIKIAEIAAGPIAETKTTIADIVKALAPAAPAAGSGAPAAPATGGGAPATGSGAPAAPAAGGAAPVPAATAPNGNGGVAGAEVTKPGVHLTPGPGVGPGPHPA